MTQEQQTKLEQAAFEAAKSVEQRDKPISTAIERSHVAKWFKIGAQTILDNPQEWFPPVQYWQLRDENEQLKSQLTRYREVLEKIANDSGCHLTECIRIAKEALKQEDATCPKCGYPLFKHLGKACCQGCDYVKQQ